MQTNIVRNTVTTIKADPGFFLVIGVCAPEAERGDENAPIVETQIAEPVIAWEITRTCIYGSAKEEADGISDDTSTEVVAIGAWGRRSDTPEIAVKGPSGECFDYNYFYSGADAVQKMLDAWNETRAQGRQMKLDLERRKAKAAEMVTHA